MNIRVITASAGSGKTTRLSAALDGAVAGGGARPEAIVATTFTREAAAELLERARGGLVRAGRGAEAQRLLAARTGTVNAVCGGLIEELAFELGLSPTLHVLDEDAAELEQKRALAGIVAPEVAEELGRARGRFERELDWHLEVRKIIEAARANGLGPRELAGCAERSIATLDLALGPAAPDGDALDAALRQAIDAAAGALARSGDTTGVTLAYRALLEQTGNDLARRRLRWGDWAKLTTSQPSKKQLAAVAPVAAAAARHVAHPRLRAELARHLRLLFQVAAAGLAAYQDHKRDRGVVDFVDQEALALDLLRRPDVRERLRGQLDLVLVDELQDTSPLQLAIFLELAALARESVWVGDQKQAIYGFRGTDPALMDAVIETLTATSTDPELVAAALATVPGRAVETLRVSYRSRPELVALTNDMFAPAFAGQGIPEARTRLEPAHADEPAGLGPIVEHWPLQAAANKDELAASVAAGVRRLLDEAPVVRDRGSAATRPARAGDVAILCRTNEQCRLVADELAALGVPAVVPRVGLLDTAEGVLALAGLRLWVDPGDALAAAQLARSSRHADDLEGLVARALAAPGAEAFAADPTVRRLLDLRAADPDLHPVAVMAAVLEATGLHELGAAWGHAAQRQGNLDALHAAAVAYARAADPPTLVGLIAQLEQQAYVWGWGAVRGDRQALLSGDEAVTVSTWHRAKGREWPLAVLYGLETVREPSATGLHVESDAAVFDVNRPLDGRWLRYWPNPYTTSNQRGAVRDALEASPWYAAAAARTEREKLRLAYVGWTRARDRVILAVAPGKLRDGLLGALGPHLLAEPGPGGAAVWGGRRVAVAVRPSGPAPARAPSREAGPLTVGRAPQAWAPARSSPSSAPPVPCTVGAAVTVGPRLALAGGHDLALVGQAVHAFLGADRPGRRTEAERVALAGALLERHGVAGALAAAEVVAASDRLAGWLDATHRPLRLHRELPLSFRRDDGTLVAGLADLVARTDGGLVLVDHKTFPGGVAQALARAVEYSGQLAAYVQALTAATGLPVTASFVHFPILGVVVPVVA